MSAAETILDRIIATKRREVAAARAALPDTELIAAAADAPPPRDFFAALAAPPAAPCAIHLIAEVKKASPSKGVIREDFDPVAIAQTYAAHGATCLSVLTDVAYFQGSLENLRAVRAAVDLPLLRKDFLIDPYQIYEARLAGADAVLLIAECLDDCRLRSLHNLAIELGLTPLVELHDAENVPRVLEAGATLIGVNNRNLRTFATDLEHTIHIQRELPPECLVVGESGIRSPADVKRLAAAGVSAMLVGEHFMASPDIGAAVDALLGRAC